jgi:hypothetical protein
VVDDAQPKATILNVVEAGRVIVILLKNIVLPSLDDEAITEVLEMKTQLVSALFVELSESLLLLQ